MQEIKIAICGNPNVGKSTLFNLLTGLHQHIGNFPGITVERKEGSRPYKGYLLTFVDIPGTYSLQGISPDELVAARVLLEEAPDIILNVADLCSLKKSLYLTCQLINLGKPMVMFLNKVDRAQERGIVTKAARLSERLGIAVVEGKAVSKEIIPLLTNAIIEVFERGRIPDRKIEFADSAGQYATLTDLVDDCQTFSPQKKEEPSSRIDRVVMHDFFAVPFFFAVMFTLFSLVFLLGNPVSGWLESGFSYLEAFIHSSLDMTHPLLASALADGILHGVGGVLVFTPNIMLMFMGIAFLEQSGYMARIAVIMDRTMERFGLSGKSIVPLILGFGCTVPAVMAARIIEQKWQRLLLVFILPFISCSAKLAVYVLIIGAFFSPGWQAPILFGLYITGVCAALLIAVFIRKTVMRGESASLFLELPDYSVPRLGQLLLSVWMRIRHFLEKAGTVIFAASLVLWVLASFPRMENEKSDVSSSYLGQIGHTLEPAVRLMGGDWKIGSSLIGALAAKEVFVSELSIIYSLSGDEKDTETSLQSSLRRDYSIVAAIAFLLFMLLSAPCIGTFAAVKSETRSWLVPIGQYGFMTVFAYLVSVLFYQVFSYLI